MRSLSSKILLLLAEAADEAIDWFELLSSPYKRLDYFSNNRKEYFQKVLKKMESIGEIEKVVKKGRPFFRISARGKHQLIKEIPILKLREKKWDKIWRVVIFDIPEEKRKIRDLLRRKLKTLGFAMWQRSVYISPFDLHQEVRELLENMGLAE